MGSITDQQFLIARESVPGVPATTGFRSYHGLKAKMGYKSDGTSFKGGGYRVNTARTVTNEYGEHDVEAPQCFNALLPVLTSVFGLPVSTPLVGAPTKGATHKGVLKGRGKRSVVPFTGIWGDEDEAFLLPYLVFNELKFGVQRSELTFETAALSRTPEEDFTLPTTGITEIPAVPIPTREYDVFIDDSADEWGTTQYLAAYDVAVEVGETWGQDTPINSAFKSYARLVESEDIDYKGKAQVGIDPAARALIADYKAGKTKYIRLSTQGPIIAGADRYAFQLDFVVNITAPGKTDTAPNSPIVVLPFDYELSSDPDSGDAIRWELTNALLTV